MRIGRWLGSPRLAAGLIAALLSLSLVSVIVPQTPTLGSKVVDEWRESEPWLAVPALALGLDRVFYSWPYWVVSALLALNLTVCTWRRAGSRSSMPRVLADAPQGVLTVRTRATADGAADLLRRGMRSFEVAAVPDGVVCRSGRFGFAGSIVMHVGMVAIVIAGLVTALTRFEGEMLLVEGIGSPDLPASHVKVTQTPRFGMPYTGAHLTIERMEFDYEGPVVTDARAFMTVRHEGTERRRIVRINYPLRVGSKSFLLKDTGYSVGIRITDPGGRREPDTLINLGEERPDGYADNARFGGLTLGLLAVPDVEAPRGMAVAHKLDPVAPAVVVSATVEGSAALRDVLVLPGEDVLAAGWRIEVLEVRRWTRLNSRMDHGMYIAYLGFTLMGAGFAARALDLDRTVRVRFSDGGAKVWANARWGREIAASAERRVAAMLTASVPASDDEEVRG